MRPENKKHYKELVRLYHENLKHAEADKDPKNLCREAYVNQRNRMRMKLIAEERYFGIEDTTLLRVVKLPDEFK